MFDPDLKYCPQCRDEYRAEIVNCGICGELLLTGTEMQAFQQQLDSKRQSRAGELTQEDDLVALRRGPLAEIKNLEELLREERIGTLVIGDPKSCGKSCCPTVYHLLVRTDDGQDAFEILEAEHARMTALGHHDTTYADSVFNPAAGEAVCPACGCKFATTSSSCPDCGLHFG